VRAATDAALMFWISGRNRAKLPLPGWVLPAVAAGMFISMGVKSTYGDQIRRFWNEVGNDWRAHEQMLAQGPRNNENR
jgi:hypothetical protein